ncbi:insulinase family protein [Leptolyngbya sp. FACHB-402]|uniref:insulinase family protein n=1 Tax=unclassified Leptolyngbya TaxID=2650499 RepID=UPI0004782D8F|nr:insulinase family protein [Leptolyngbya sp. FACHB-1624]MBD2368770.1 insulinase family protein [Leptolyngbya sp. FACHB-161]MBD2375362.1 insulinase family protein [Leptolyngbya sp. FACHB-238]MBD2399780.1 insulinase family protein [Leptolyngbya sp. FACHB-239]MBD2405986.1 insulinase family protein [Leptolyngbya sp. FACHB-402]
MYRSPQNALFVPATVHRFDNGLTLIHHDLPTTGIAAIDVWVNAGSIVEPDEWSGMAHFLEHMIFKGTEKIAPGEFDQAIEKRGGMTNAATSYDYAHFYMTTAAQDFADTLPYLGELLLNAAIPEDEFEREREVVLEEILQTYDNPDAIAFQFLAELVYQRHPYGRSILGTEESLMRRSAAEMRSFHRTHYQPENMTVVVTGDIRLDHVKQQVEQAFHTFPEADACRIHIAEAEPPITTIRREEIQLPRLEQARLLMAWMAPGVEAPVGQVDETLPWKRFEQANQQDPLRAACGLDLISAVLGAGRTSRLVQELREERHLVQGIDCSFSLQRDSSLFTIAAWLDADDLQRVEALICDRLSQLMTVPISQAELDRAKRLLCNDYAFSIETPGQLAGLYGYYHSLAEITAAAAYPHLIQSFTVEDLRDLASQYLSPYHYAAIVVTPGD